MDEAYKGCLTLTSEQIESSLKLKREETKKVIQAKKERKRKRHEKPKVNIDLIWQPKTRAQKKKAIEELGNDFF